MADRDSANPIWNLFDAALQHVNIRVECTCCPNTAVINAAGLWWHFHQKEWAESIRTSRDRIYCRKCRSQSGRKIRPRVSVTEEPVTRFLTEPTELEWKQACRRIR